MRRIARDRIDVGKLAVMTISVNAFQIISALFIAILVLYDPALLGNLYTKLLIVLVLLIVCWGGYYDIREALAARKLDDEADTLKEIVLNMEALYSEMRKQRHDYMNHLQVIYSLTELGESGEALKYIQQVHKDIARVGSALKTAHPALNALISAKMNDANEKGVAFSLNASTALEHLKIPAWEVCRALGNLIDNAFEALKSTRPAVIKVSLEENKDMYYLTVSNNGPEIEKSVLSRIFEEGFSTKGENRGMGLSIVSDIASQAGGGLYVETTPAITAFRIELPKN